MPAPVLRNTVSAGGWIAISGQLGHRDGAIVPGGAEAETPVVLENFVSALKIAGVTPADVVKTTVFLTSLDDLPMVNEQYTRVFGQNPPARSAVQVVALPRGASVEIEGWAYSK
jgi:2-iminobutanoate/2-iminopropanoate deaminase